jgi:replicative DNA helicase
MNTTNEAKIRKILANKIYSEATKLAKITEIVSADPAINKVDITKISDVLSQMKAEVIMPPLKIESGLNVIDNLFSGLFEGEICILGGRPGMGNTQLLITLANNFLEARHPVLFLGFENDPKYFVNRFLATKTGLNLHQILRKEVEKKNESLLKKAAEKLNTQPLYFCESINPNNFLDYCKTQIDEKQMKVFIIENLTEFYKNCSKKEAEIISKGIHAIAKEYKVLFLLATSLSRSLEMRGGSRVPYFSDFRVDDYLIHFADKFIALYRPEYYGLTVDEFGNDMLGVLQLYLVKNRNGDCDSGDLKVSFSRSKIENINEALPYYNYQTLQKRNIVQHDFLKIQLDKLFNEGLLKDDLSAKTGLKAPKLIQDNDAIYMAAKYYIQKMDIEMLELVLDEATYQDMPKNIFLNNLEILFAKMRGFGDTFFYSITGDCSNCFKGKNGFTFVGNNTGNYFNLLFMIENHRLIDLHECSEMKLPALGVELHLFMSIDNSINSESDLPF